MFRDAPWVVVVGAVVGMGACSPQAPPPDLSVLLTRAEASDFEETSSYQDVMAFARALDESSDRIHLTSFGRTSEGRDLPLLVVGDVADASPEAVLATGKTRVYLQGNIHGGEVPGKEALLMLLRGWVEGEYPDWTESMVLLVAPIYNADGNERVELTNRPRQHGPVGGMGQRPNAQGLDLNRDHMKLDSPEARSLVGLLNDYDPHVGVDLHTTNGTRHAYHLTYSPPLHPDTHADIVALLRDDWLPALTMSIKEKHGWDYYYYGNAGGGRGRGRGGGGATGEPSWRTFDHRPRFNNNYIGLRNRIAILSEAYAYATFEDRVLATLYFVEEILDYAHAHGAEIRRVVETADGASVVGMPLSVRATPERSAERVEILMGEVDEEAHPVTGEVMLRRRDVSLPTPMYEYGTFAPAETEVAQATYVIPAELTGAIERLEIHGVRLERLASAQTVELEEFVIDSTRVAERAFQGRTAREVWGSYRTAERTLPAGTVLVSVAQPLGRLAFHLLEPRADDGFLTWALLDDHITPGHAYPILRSHVPLSP